MAKGLRKNRLEKVVLNAFQSMSGQQDSPHTNDFAAEFTENLRGSRRRANFVERTNRLRSKMGKSSEKTNYMDTAVENHSGSDSGQAESYVTMHAFQGYVVDEFWLMFVTSGVSIRVGLSLARA